jgi:MFS transporter, DHA1 family, multidrug resistance protein
MTEELKSITGTASINDFAAFGYEWSIKERRKILLVVSLVSFLGPFTNFLFLPSFPEIIEEFNATTYEVTLASALFQLPMAVLPLFWGPLSERVGRRKIYLFIAMFMIIVFYVTALTRTIWGLIVMRFLTGIPIAALFVLGYSVISDVFPPDIRAKAVVCK